MAENKDEIDLKWQKIRMKLLKTAENKDEVDLKTAAIQ